MANCKFLEHISDFLLGEYEGDSVLLREHINSCKECLAEFNELSRLYKSIQYAVKYKSEIVPSPPSGFDVMREEVLLRTQYFQEIMGDPKNILKFEPPIILNIEKRRAFISDIVDNLTCKDPRNVIITGPPGYGKKTALKWIFAEILERKGFPIIFPPIKNVGYECRRLIRRSEFVTILLADVDLIPSLNLLSRRQPMLPKVRFVLTAFNQRIINTFPTRLIEYRVDGIEPDQAWKIIDELSGVENSREYIDISFVDKKWTLVRAKFTARLVKMARCSQIKMPIENDRDLIFQVLNLMFKEHQVDCDFAFEFLKRLAHLIFSHKEKFIDKRIITDTLIRTEARQGRRVDQPTFLSNLCEMDIMQRSGTLYGFSDLIPFGYYLLDRPLPEVS